MNMPSEKRFYALSSRFAKLCPTGANSPEHRRTEREVIRIIVLQVVRTVVRTVVRAIVRVLVVVVEHPRSRQTAPRRPTG